MIRRLLFVVSYIFFLTVLLRLPIYAAGNPTLLLDRTPKGTVFSGAMGPLMKYKRVAGPHDFGGEMLMWGIRGFAGKNNDPKLGFVYSTGNLSGTGFKLNLDMGGLSLEDSFRQDPRVKWRVSFGGGKYKMSTVNSGYVVNDGSFTFLEPMIIGVLPASRHIVFEFAVGYTFADATGVRIEGLALQAEMLFGRF